jgi:DNA-binding response OmpR family regulator
MHTPPRILVVDDQPQNVQILKDRLEGEDYEILTATTGEAALEMSRAQEPDLILLDVIMPGMDGIEVCRRLKANAALPFMPIVMITAKSGVEDLVTGFEAGADEYLTKPLDQAALIARVKSMLRLKSFHDVACDQATQLEVEVAARERWNETLEHQMQKQITDLECMGRLKQFLSPPLAEWVVSLDGGEPSMSQHREVTILCCALPGFMTLVNRVESEVVFGVLQAYYESIGPLITKFGGHLKRIDSDELLVVFNAPLPCSDPVIRAVSMAIDMRLQLAQLTGAWRSTGHALDFGIGVAHGDAILRLIDLDGQLDYAVIGSPRYLASRLCGEAEGGRILVSQSVWQRIKDQGQADPAGELTVHGHTDPIPVYEVTGR